jgi:hypothetical protein
MIGGHYVWIYLKEVEEEPCIPRDLQGGRDLIRCRVELGKGGQIFGARRPWIISPSNKYVYHCVTARGPDVLMPVSTKKEGSTDREGGLARIRGISLGGYFPSVLGIYERSLMFLDTIIYPLEFIEILLVYELGVQILEKIWVELLCLIGST